MAAPADPAPGGGTGSRGRRRAGSVTGPRHLRIRWPLGHGRTNGIDIAAPIGTPIHVPLAGVVVNSGPASGFGMWVRVRHTRRHDHRRTGTSTARSCRSAQQVAAGQEIAEVGNRGQSTGPHLHIGVMQNGVYVNPKPWLDARGIRY